MRSDDRIRLRVIIVNDSLRRDQAITKNVDVYFDEPDEDLPFDCGWDPDYSNLRKVEHSGIEGFYHVNERGIRHGLYVSFYDIEQTQANWAYCCYEGEYHGKYVSFWENGNQKGEEHYDMGVRHGLLTQWHENGRLYWEATYYNGKAHGPYIRLDSDGNKLREGTWTHGERTGIWFFRSKDGSSRCWDYDNSEAVPCP